MPNLSSAGSPGAFRDAVVCRTQDYMHYRQVLYVYYNLAMLLRLRGRIMVVIMNWGCHV